MGKEGNPGDRALELFLSMVGRADSQEHHYSQQQGHVQLDGRDSREFPANALVHRPVLLKYIISSKVKMLCVKAKRCDININQFLCSRNRDHKSDSSTIHLHRLEYHIREKLNETASRAMVVLNPIKVVIVNLAPEIVMDLDAKKWPDAPNDVLYKRIQTITMVLPRVNLCFSAMHSPLCMNVVLAEEWETVVEVQADYDLSKKTKPKGVLHWVAEPFAEVEPLQVEVRLFDKLFLSENPADLDGERFQFERIGYFVVDKDSTKEKLEFNQDASRQLWLKYGEYSHAITMGPLESLKNMQLCSSSVAGNMPEWWVVGYDMEHRTGME
ncbi:hypothetical protein MLD38_003910 [Melastoma candidum]|uniref:Uncharacterized protein n=1 Tax=Melastoma candidum TaxID=119954 RepID=A0ACB9S7W9_9MYRT|nr:hypothetical protein MLD38_003910 [Melastoma candidum]